MSGHSRSARAGKRGLAQHFLGSARLARELVDAAGISQEDRVVEFGGGTGLLTEALAVRAAHVLAIEVDPKLALRLAGRFVATPSVTVLKADAFDVPLPVTPYRVMANVPFNATTAILRRLLDEPTGSLMRADLVVQWQVARARANASDGPPTDLIGATWGPWWHFERGRRLPAALFRPRPSVDAAVLTVTRRPVDLLPVSQHEPYAAFLRRSYEFAHVETLLSRLFARSEIGALRRELDLPATATPVDLVLNQWVGLFLAHRKRSV